MTGNSLGNTRKTFGFSRFSALIGLRVSCGAQAKGLIAYNFHSLKRDMFRIRFAISLTAASNATNVIGTLEMVSATSRIVMEEGASLAFSTVDASKWAEGAQLIIEWESVGSSSLRIGSSASALTPGQRSALKGYVPGIDRLLRVLFDENGYARPWMGGMTISIR